MYSPTLMRFIQADPTGAEYVDGPNLYQMERGNPVNLVDPSGLAAQPTFKTEADRERYYWQPLAPLARRSLDFWIGFLDLRMGADNRSPLNRECIDNFMRIIRAMSWVESKHGTAGQNQPARDPMQSGNPNDDWWKTISVPTGPQGDRFVGGPNAKNYWANGLAAAVGQTMPPRGHNDETFTPQMSYFWGVALLIQKSNKVNGQTYKCSRCSMEQLVAGAVAYNGGGDPQYKQKIENALELIGPEFGDYPDYGYANLA